MEETLSSGGKIAFFEGAAGNAGVVDNRQWLEAVINGTEPLVKPEEALVVTKILEAIYEADRQKKEIRF